MTITTDWWHYHQSKMSEIAFAALLRTFKPPTQVAVPQLSLLFGLPPRVVSLT